MQVSWKQTLEDIESCHSCPLRDGCTHVVPGEGNPRARIMFVGEGPGGDEDRLGRPFVGRAGQLLDRMLEAMPLARAEVYIANVIKCRPPRNRTPLPEEVQACLPHLRRQVALVRPRIIVCMGATAAQAIIDPNLRITRDRGMWTCRKNVWMMPTFHPAALLRDADKKKDVWIDLQNVMLKLKELDAQGGDV
nr:uracil-DNA glycosylase [Maliibacterium massiliense]